VFAVLQKAIISFIMSVCLSVSVFVSIQQIGSHWKDFLWNFIFGHFSKICPNNSSLTRIIGTLHEELRTFVSICRSVLLRLRNISDKICKKIRHILYFSENRAVYEIMWKIIVQPDWPHITFWCMRFACWLRHTQCNLFMAKMVTWTHFVVLFILTLPVFFNIKLRIRRAEQPRYVFYYPFQILVLFFNLRLSLIQWRWSWVFSGTFLVVYRIKNHRIRENGNLGIHCRRRLGSLKISYISYPLPLGFQIANTGVVLLHFFRISHFPCLLHFPLVTQCLIY
jgi:hypothetical protein